jgi:hypothetical protein
VYNRDTMEEENILYAESGFVVVIPCKILGITFKEDVPYVRIYDTRLHSERQLKLDNTYLTYQEYIKDK